jgi:DNA topoisomerase-1
MIFKKMVEPKEYDLEKRWELKRESIYNLRDNIARLKRKILADIHSSDEKARLTALAIRLMMLTSERVGNEESATNGHFGITHFRKKHIDVIGSAIHLNYVGKSGVDHDKVVSDATAAKLLQELLHRKSQFVFTTADGFRIKADKINRYLKPFGAKSKDIRGFNANRYMLMELNRIGKIKDEKERPKVFNAALRKIGQKIGHGAATLRKQYLLPEIEEQFYAKGYVTKVKI